MNVLSHALLPALLAAPLLPRYTGRAFCGSAGIVALAGALPDVLHPHLSLAARYASWSHTAYAFLAGSGAGLALAALPRLRPWRRALRLAPLAYATHLLLDSISGGIAWLYPFSPEVLGHRLIYYRAWFPIDVVLAAIACILVVWIGQRDRRGARPPHSAQPADFDEDR